MIKKIILKAIKLYQVFLSPLIGRHCCFYPSCSSYLAEKVQRNGAAKGLRQSFFRLLRCHPFSRGGVDLP